MTTRTFSAVQPTGDGVPHLGNLYGALKRFPGFTGDHPQDALFCVADLHATTTAYDPKRLRQASRTTAASLLAVGLEAYPCTVFVQSHVEGHAVLALTLGHLARMGELERMTQFKEKGRSDDRESTRLGLLTYPVLMSADVLLYRAERVPVGRDQQQHLQLVTELAARFNKTYDKALFPVPRGEGMSGFAARVADLRDPLRKMSKSSPEGAVFMMDTPDVAAAQFRRATSESEPLPSEVAGLEGRMAAAALVGLLGLMTDTNDEDLLARLGGKGFSVLKGELTDAFVERVAPLGRRMREILDDVQVLNARLERDADVAEGLARETLCEVRRLTGTGR